MYMYTFFPSRYGLGFRIMMRRNDRGLVQMCHSFWYDNIDTLTKPYTYEMIMSRFSHETFRRKKNVQTTRVYFVVRTRASSFFDSDDLVALPARVNETLGETVCDNQSKICAMCVGTVYELKCTERREKRSELLV